MTSVANNLSAKAPYEEVMSKALDLGRPMVDTACGLINALLGKPCTVAGEMLADQVYAWQWGNRVRVAARAEEILREEKVAAKVLPPGFLMPLLEGAGSSDEPEIQEWWAQLLAEAVSNEAARRPIFCHVIRQMTGAEARLFVELWEKQRPAKAGSRSLGVLGPPPRLVQVTPRVSAGEALLEAMGLIEHITVRAVEDTPHSLMAFSAAKHGPQITAFGQEFAKHLGFGRRNEQVKPRTSATPASSD